MIMLLYKHNSDAKNKLLRPKVMTNDKDEGDENDQSKGNPTHPKSSE